MRRRSVREIRDRLWQEWRNAALWLRPPKFSLAALPPSPLPGLPDPAAIAARLRGTAFHDQIRSIGGEVLAGRIPVFDTFLDAGPDIRWRRDYAASRETGLGYFRTIPYLDSARAGDHKMIWEMNRHQHLVVLAQAACLEPDETPYTTELFRQLESWWSQNPFHRGINWSSALEVAFRTLSWIWIYHLTASHMPQKFRERFQQRLYEHGCHLRNNLSFYFSPNTHLLGEAVALHALGALFPAFPDSLEWAATGSRVVEQQMERQVHEDGSHFEQSSYYHVYALDMFLFHAILKRPQPDYMRKLERMTDYLNTLMGPARRLAFLGDDDGGRFFHPYGSRDCFGRATLATAAQVLGNSSNAPKVEYADSDLHEQAAWWFGTADGSSRGKWESRYFPDAGIAVVMRNDCHAIFDAGPFGPWSGGHSHADTLGLVLRCGDEELLIDPATYTYVGDLLWRDRFRSAAFHNTLSLEGTEQAEPAGPFAWSARPDVQVRKISLDPACPEIEAECRYAQFLHRRRLLWPHPDLLVVIDTVEGPADREHLSLHWHCGVFAQPQGGGVFALGTRARMFIGPCTSGRIGTSVETGWRSKVFGSKELAEVIVVSRDGSLPATIFSGIALNGSTVQWKEEAGRITVALEIGQEFAGEWTMSESA